MTDISVHSIFNDVLGPILAGPSSSHSGGCARIGLTVRNLFGKDIKKAVIVFDAAGSYPSTYIGQGSNFGFTGGLLGMKTDNPELKNSVQIAKEQGHDISFSQEMLSHTHPNEARIDVYGDDGTVEMNALTLSTGGGTFEITQLDGFPIFINGNCRLSFVKCITDGVEKIEDLMKQEFPNAEIKAVKKETEPDESHMLLIVKGLSEEQKQSLDEFSAHTEIISIRHSGKILPVSMKPADNEPIFHNAAGALNYNKDHSFDAADLAIAYEMSVGRTTKEEVMELAKHTYDIMRHAATTQPDPATETRFGFMPYQCTEMLEKKESGTINLAPTGCLDQALFYAASMALQNMLGLICDPVGGLTEIPCISRNVSVEQALPESLRCTCTGGLCVTPTGKCLGNCTK